MDSTNTTQPELQWPSWIPQLNPAEASARPNGGTIRDLGQGDKRAAAARTGGEDDTRNHFTFPQIEWPAWMATDHAAPSDLTKARQQASIMPTSPTTEDGIGVKPSNKRASKASKGLKRSGKSAASSNKQSVRLSPRYSPRRAGAKDTIKGGRVAT
jgi:hypothetical protein